MKPIGFVVDLAAEAGGLNPLFLQIVEVASTYAGNQGPLLLRYV